MDDYQKEMETNYRAFKKHIYAQLRAEALRTYEPIPGDDLEAYAKAVGAVPLETFIHEIESPPRDDGHPLSSSLGAARATGS